MVNFRNLDLGYEQCRDLYTAVKSDGENLLTNLKQVYSGLNSHWKGTDATLHINQLVDIHTAVNVFVADTGNAVAYAAQKISEVQAVRRANGSSGAVGEELSKLSEHERLTKVEETDEYSCTPEAKNDYELLVQVCGEFDSFVSTVHEKTEELMGNWIDGNERDKVVKNSSDFESLSDEYKRYLSETKDALDIAVRNLQQIM